jgi:UDP-N-acetylglucosamine 4,6-dehydratase/5-epimerase
MNFYNKKRVLVTGACGSIGSSLVLKLLLSGSIVCAFDNSEDGLFKLSKSISPDLSKRLRIFLGDIRDKDRLISACEDVDFIFHCAALKHVGISEYNPFEAVKTNIIGCQNIIDAAIENNITKVLFTSSDKAVNPTGTMGATKLIGEKLFVSANNYVGNRDISFGCIRFGNVLNTNGSVLQIFKKQLESATSLTVTDPRMSRFFISMEQAVSLCMDAGDRLIGGETFVLDMGCCDVPTLARAYIGEADYQYLEIGAHAGEKLYEELFTDTEAERTVLSGGMYVILPETMIESTNKALAEEYKGGFQKQSLRSDINLMSYNEIRKILVDLNAEWKNL